jgi:hypothetical protein
LTLQLSQGTGTGLGGGLVMQVAPASSTGSTPNSFVTALTVDARVHLKAGGTAPALTSCGTSPTIAGTDTAGTITEGSAASGCTATFNKAFAATPYCVMSSQGGLGFTYAVSTTAITITNVGALSSTKVDYHCLG